jgi:RNA recognition motif-containing protein
MRCATYHLEPHYQKPRGLIIVITGKQDLLRKTVGMTRESFMCHDEKGRPLGIAIIAFVNPAHAAAARTRYNRKVIDGRECWSSSHSR